MLKTILSSLFSKHKTEEFRISVSAFLHEEGVDNNEINASVYTPINWTDLTSSDAL